MNPSSYMTGLLLVFPIILLMRFFVFHMGMH